MILKHSIIELYVRPNTPETKRKKIVDEWYRKELKVLVPKLISKWEEVIGVESNEFGIKKMRTKWGTCNIEAKRIWLNLELAKKIRLKPSRRIEFFNATIDCRLLEYELYAGTKRVDKLEVTPVG